MLNRYIKPQTRGMSRTFLASITIMAGLTWLGQPGATLAAAQPRAQGQRYAARRNGEDEHDRKRDCFEHYLWIRRKTAWTRSQSPKETAKIAVVVRAAKVTSSTIVIAS